MATITEEEAIAELADFLNSAQETLLESPENQTESGALAAFQENVRFIGHQEFTEAVESLAKRWLKLCQDKEVFVYFGADRRSERWVGIQVFKKIRQKIKENLHYIADTFSLGQLISVKNPESWRIMIIDDVRISGVRSDGYVAEIFRALERNGVSRQTASQNLELNLIASRANKPSVVQDFQLPIYSHFVVPAYENAPFGSCSFTGWWRSTDYGFTSFLDDLLRKINNVRNSINFHKRRLVAKHGPEIVYDETFRQLMAQSFSQSPELSLPALTRIKPPYETDAKGQYLDSGLEEEWLKLRENWEKKPPSFFKSEK